MNQIVLTNGKKVTIYYKFKPELDDLLKLSIDHKISLRKLKVALDQDEISRIDYDTSENLILVDVPMKDVDNQIIDTIPLGIIYNQDTIVLVSTIELKTLKSVINEYDQQGSIQQIVYNILIDITASFLQMLRSLENQSRVIEKNLREAIDNAYLLDLLDTQKSLFYISNALVANQIVYKRMIRYEEKDTTEYIMLEDLNIDNEQAIQMSEIYTNILNGTLDALSSIISNNQNIFIKYLTIVSLIMAVPTIIASFFGMNVPLPFSTNKYGFLIIIVVSTICTILLTIYINKRKIKLK